MKVRSEVLILETFIPLLMESGTKSDGKNLISWKKFIRIIIAQVDVTYNKYGLKCGTSLRFWENIVWINEIDPYGWFQWYFRYRLSRRSEDDERQINREKKLSVGLEAN